MRPCPSTSGILLATVLFIGSAPAARAQVGSAPNKLSHVGDTDPVQAAAKLRAQADALDQQLPSANGELDRLHGVTTGAQLYLDKLKSGGSAAFSGNIGPGAADRRAAAAQPKSDSAKKAFDEEVAKAQAALTAAKAAEAAQAKVVQRLRDQIAKLRADADKLAPPKGVRP